MPTAGGCQRGHWAATGIPREVRTRPNEPWTVQNAFKEKSSVFFEKLFFECLMSAPGLRLAGIFSFLDLFALRLRRFCFRLLTCKQNGQEVLQ